MPKRLPRARTQKGDPKLAYYDSGGGTPTEAPIILLHGATFRSEDWENIFPRLATRYRVIAYDARGHGKSGRAASYGVRLLADDLDRILALVGRPAIVIGHSLGGATALLSAARDPRPFRALVLEDPIVSLYGTGWRGAYYEALRAALALQADPSALRAAIARLPLPSPGPRGERTVGEVRGFYAPERLAGYYADVDPAFVDAFIAGDPDGHAALIAAAPPVPTLLLAADPKESALAPGDIERLGGQDGVQVQRFPGQGHRIHGMRPELFLETLEPFLRAHRAA
ncbi:MAG TPA: alpha/beta hydrolase [Candidatus Saccharimonadales bacterium]|nr:alpha/beta hydrolase [Candidatus Saccharimonadales bacterium]